MTMFTAFTEQFRKQDICLFSDFIADAAPFGITSTATTGLSSASYSNTNYDTASAKQPFGVLTMSLTTTTNLVGGIYPAIGVYPSAPIAAGGNVDRTFRVGRGEIDFECRLRTLTTDANAITTHGIGLPIDASGIATHFVGFYAYGNEANWTAVLVSNSTVVRSVATNIPKGAFAEFRVFLNADASRSKVYANGALVATFDGQLSKTAGLLPHIEIRNKTQTAAAAQFVECDYMMVKLKANR